MSYFRNRWEAGKMLARALSEKSSASDAVVLAPPRGAVPVAFEIASTLRLPLDVVMVRKLGVPGHEELALGAIAEPDIVVLEPLVVTELNLGKNTIETIVAREELELVRQERACRAERSPVDLDEQQAILVDDGLASTAALKAAVMSLRRRNVARIILATPTLASSSCEVLGALVDRIVCATTPEPFFEIVTRYADRSPITDRMVRTLLAEASRGYASSHAIARP